MESWQILKQNLSKLLLELSEKLKPQDVRNIQSLIDEGEELIALEILCSQLNEWNSYCSLGELGRIKILGEELGLAESYLEEIPIKDDLTVQDSLVTPTQSSSEAAEG